MSFFSKLWRAIRLNTPARCVGRDLEGNMFYEKPSSLTNSRMKRTVKYRHPDDMWNYIGGGKRLAIQWSAWLSHTRMHPPTVAELEADVARQQRVQLNAAMIEAREQTERQKALQIESSPMSSIPPGMDAIHASESRSHAAEDSAAAAASSQLQLEEQPSSRQRTYHPPETQSWVPTATPRVRG